MAPVPHYSGYHLSIHVPMGICIMELFISHMSQLDFSYIFNDLEYPRLVIGCCANQHIWTFQ